MYWEQVSHLACMHCKIYENEFHVTVYRALVSGCKLKMAPNIRFKQHIEPLYKDPLVTLQRVRSIDHSFYVYADNNIDDFSNATKGNAILCDMK